MIRDFDFKRILVVSLDNLGDLVFASALTPPLHDAFPGAAIDVWCKAYTAAIAPLIPHVRRVIAADPIWGRTSPSSHPSVSKFLRAFTAVIREKYDLAILSEAPWRTAAVVAATRIPMRVGLARHRNGPFLTHVLPEQDADRPVLLEQARLLSAVGIDVHNAVYRLDPTQLNPIRAELARNLPERFIALHPFAGDSARCVEIGHWAQVAFALANRGVTTLWIGTRRELADLRRSITHPRGLYADQVGDGSLESSAAALSLASAFVGHDSGPLHVAAAFGIPVVGIFAPGQPKRTFPQGPGPWRMIHENTPPLITAGAMLREIDALLPSAT